MRSQSFTGPYKLVAKGKPFTKEYRVHYEKNGKTISPFHDIPLYANEEKTLYNMVVEIPRWTNAKVEIATKEPFNPLKQDVKKGKVRFVRNCFPYKGYIWNYGAFPQTWEDPTVINADTNARGDNDPLDVCEIGQSLGYTGQVKQVKILGIIALLDEGETDWKVIAIDARDPLANEMNDIEDVERLLPGLINATREWFRVYKIPDGKPENRFAFNGECKNKAYATHIVQETHDAWKRLITGVIPPKSEHYEINVKNATVEGSPYKLQVSATSSAAESNITAILDQQIASEEDTDEKWYFVKASL